MNIILGIIALLLIISGFVILFNVSKDEMKKIRSYKLLEWTKLGNHTPLWGILLLELLGIMFLYLSFTSK